ncbi:MAG: fused MFS/spermidine synthase [Deltaproteobacteria bacterium]|nr:fused MFS/spermidine synthase [Deltaproteobacteria bacterium]
MTSSSNAAKNRFNLFIYVNAFFLGIVLMSLEMLGSRYLNPYFGSSIYIWAALISTVLLALAIGYFLGGALADKAPSPLLLGILILCAAYYIALIPLFYNQLCAYIYSALPENRVNSLIASLCLLFLPLLLLGIFSPFAIKLVLAYNSNAGRVSGRIYGISTIGNIFGTLLTTFFLIPLIGTRLITYVLSLINFLCAFSFFALYFFYDDGKSRKVNTLLKSLIHRKKITTFAVFFLYCVLLIGSVYISDAAENSQNISLELQSPDSYKDNVLLHTTAVEKKAEAGGDPLVSGPLAMEMKTVAKGPPSANETYPASSHPNKNRVAYTKEYPLGDRQSGLLASIETEYNNIYIYKNREYITMKFVRFGTDYTESTSNTIDDAELPIFYTRVMLVGLLYADSPRNILMIGLGGGTVTNYLHKFLKNDAYVRAVELDKGVIAAAKKYFHTREFGNYKIIENDGRLYLFNTKQSHDIIMLDAFRGGYVPFHLLTKEFYALANNRLSPGGCLVINLHASTELFPSALATMKQVFPNVETFQAQGNVIAVAYQGEKKNDKRLKKKAAYMQNKYHLNYDLEKIYSLKYNENYEGASVLTDDFSPAYYLDSIKRHNQKQW